MAKDEALRMAIEAMCDFDYDKRLEAIKFCKDALEQPTPKNCTPLDEYIAEMEKDPEIKQLLDIAREDVKKWSTQPAQEPECNSHPDAPHGFCRDASHSAGRYVCECEGWEAEQPAQKLWGWYDNHDIYNTKQSDESIPLYTHPAPSWQGLSDDDVKAIEEVLGIDKVYIRAVERTLKEKNHGANVG